MTAFFLFRISNPAVAVTFSVLDGSRAYCYGKQLFAIVDDVVGEFEAGVTDLFALNTVISHRKVSDIISVVHELQQFFVSLFGSFPIFFNRGSALACANMED